MIKIVQFGEGNFLRSFVDLYFDTLNKENNGLEYQVNIVKPITFGSVSMFAKQNNRYHVILRGVSNGKANESVYEVNSVHSVIDPFNDMDSYLSLADDPELKIIVSNTTEAGITYSDSDEFDGFESITYPAKLVKFLLRRYQKRLPGVYLLPVELIDHNADTLKECVLKYISLWKLEEGFLNYINNECYFCSTLVDRIVSGYPRDEETKKHCLELIKEEDNLFSIAEPFGLWVIEDKGNLSSIIKDGRHNIDVILSDSIVYYKKRKVRVLNGSHTNLVPISLWKGMVTVYDVMQNDSLYQFVKNTLKEDINPYVSDDLKATEAFADDVIERFKNPYLNHQLVSISLNSISKWRARDLPSFDDFYKKNGVAPTYLSIGFAYLTNMYMRIEKEGDKFVCHLPSRTIEVKDDLKCLTYFASHNLHEFLKDESLWGMDLTSYKGFEEKINNYLTRINNGEDLL